ncbi:von Willebrand factor D and EGF domain-containing protein-like [Branchiostoma lanceolatum]|uniref:von Willebrand factor D and EGF domain-containing protein-like n=1 Tax=Branchiostoma lanceolatum TaxID=7740 RepID=UPI003451825E
MPKDSATNTFLANLAEIVSGRWLGLTDANNDGQWEFEDGQTLTSSDFSNWLSGEPAPDNGRGGCVGFWGHGSEWDEKDCSILRGFICQLNEGIDPIPMLTDDPVLHPPVVDAAATQVTFTCEVNYDPADVRANFEVRFLFDNVYFQDVPISTLTAGKRRANLDAKHLGAYNNVRQSKLGKHVSCLVRAFYAVSPSAKSDWRQSNIYWAGIQATQDTVVIEEAEEEFPLQLYSTVPFVCTGGINSIDQCYVDVPIAFDTNEDEVSVKEACRIRFYASGWDGVNLRTEAQTALVAVKDFKEDYDKEMSINFGKITHAPVNNAGVISPHSFNGYTPQVNIRITMPSGASVLAEGHPWMRITISAPGIDFGHTEGLCGTFDGNPNNDLMMPDGRLINYQTWPNWERELSEGWSIERGKSLFDVECLPKVASSPLAESQYCTCKKGKTQECDWTKAWRQNSLDGVDTAVNPNRARMSCTTRGKRDAQNIEEDPLLYNDDVEETEYEFDYGENFEPVVNDEWPTPNLGLTEQQVRDFCQESIWNLTIAEVCQDVYGVDILDGVDACMGDIKAM